MSERGKEKRQTILAGAAEVFRREGFEAASMDRIAEVAEVSKRTVYNHFGSKEALFTAVVEGLMDQLEALKVLRWDPECPPADQLREIASVKAALVADESVRSLVKVVLGVAIKRPALASAIVARAQVGDEHLVKWLRAADEDAVLDVPDPKLAAQLFWSMVAGALFWPGLFEAPLPAKERAAMLDEIIATFLARYLR